MRPTDHRAVALLAALTLLLPASFPAVAEVTGGSADDDTLYVLILGLTEDPDPIGTMIQWQAIQPADGSILNENGSLQNDGRPDVAYLPGTGYPIVVWATNAGTDYDVSLSQWLGDLWSEYEYLAESAEDELDPRVHVSGDGKVHVAWWVDQGAGVVQISTRNDVAGLWSLPRTVTTDGRRPSVLVHGQRLLVAFERDVAGGKEIVLAELHADGSVGFESVHVVASTGPLDVILHAYEGRLWIDWKAAADQFAYAERLPSGWTGPVLVPWDDPSWLGEEMIRREIRSQLLFP